jgi:hypothetical protein
VLAFNTKIYVDLAYNVYMMLTCDIMLLSFENFLCELSYNILCQILDVILLIGHMISVTVIFGPSCYECFNMS